MVFHVLLLLWRHELIVGVHKQPTALLVLNVSADFADLLRCTEAVQVVVLRLEVDAHVDKRTSGCVIRLAILDACNDHPQGHRAVERVEGCLVLDNEVPSGQAEVIHIDVHAEEVQQLSALGLEGRYQEEIHQLAIVGLHPEVTLQCPEHEVLDQKGVIDGYLLDVRILVPAWLASSSLGVVHDVVGNQEPGLQPLDAPPENGELGKHVAVHGCTARSENLRSTGDDCETSIHFAPLDVVVKHILDPLHFRCRHLAHGRQLCDSLIDEQVADAHERLLVVLGLILRVCRPGILARRRLWEVRSWEASGCRRCSAVPQEQIRKQESQAGQCR
mmetsp:Transcript_60504/g.131083  ORF Transcript_60504/g.131083 Transcript_60504/m.131083 type:complete len:331 (-) Transcript_60504:156-1148(-)